MVAKGEPNVPERWQRMRLGDVAEVRKGESFTSRNLVPGDIPVIAGGTSPAYYHAYSNRSPGVITVSASGANAGFVAYHKTPIFATDCSTIQGKGQKAANSFIFHFLKNIQEMIYYRRRGSAQPHVYPEDLAALHILLPPLPEQRAIAAVLDSIDDAIEGAEAVIAATEQLRDSLLHDLLTRGLPGQHTEWRDVPGLGTIPADWEVVRLGDVATVQTGRAVNKGSRSDGVLEVPYLSVANVKDGYLDLGVVKTMRVSQSEIQRYGLRQGDVLFTEGGDADKLGRGTVWKEEIPLCLHQNHVFAVRPEFGVLKSEFLSAFAGSGFGKRYFLGAAKQTTNLASVNSSQLKQMTLALPDIREQGKIIGALSGMGVSIQEATAERNNLQVLKESAADALLTGRVRIQDTP